MTKDKDWISQCIKIENGKLRFISYFYIYKEKHNNHKERQILRD